MAGLKPWHLRRRWSVLQLAVALAISAAVLQAAGHAWPLAPPSEGAFTAGRYRPRARVTLFSDSLPERGRCAADVLEQFKELQKTNHSTLDWPWARYCIEEADGVMDPSRLPTEVVERFLERWRSGEFHFKRASQETLEKLNMYKKCAKIQKKWNWYCAHKKRCFGIMDPAALPAGAVQHFLENHCPGDPPEGIAKPSELASIDLVAQVDSLQRREPLARWPWARYCEEEARGVRTPSQLPMPLVERFLDEWKQGKLKVAPPSEDMIRMLIKKMKSRKVQRAWNWYINHRKGCYGQRTPRALPADLVEEFLTRHCSKVSS